MLSENAKKIIKDLYSINGEDVDDVFKRVAKEFATNETELNLAFRLQKENVWRPNTPVYFNAGSDHPMFSACWVVGLEDTMNSIYDIANVARKIFQHGAGIGIPIGNLRGKDAHIYEGKPDGPPTGKSSGPISFMKLYDAVGETTKSGGRARRAAILCCMPVWHPDIMEFISCKEIDGRLSNMNISVSITDGFMKALEQNTPYQLINPANGEMTGEVIPLELWNKLTEMAWKSAEPGVLFIDTINKDNPLKKITLIESTNPCVTGDTLIAVADGRNAVSIRQLAEEGKDIPVYCKDNNGITKIRMMRNPRITGYKQKIYSVNLDDGSCIKCTGNHKFLMKDGSIKEAKTLLSNDSIMISSKWKATIEEIIKNSNSKSQEYWLTNNGKKNVFEHRLIYEELSGKKIPKGYVIHHKDHNSLNNNFDNLVPILKEEHDNLHDISGDKNPMRRFPEKNIFNNPEVQRRIREKYHIGAKRTKETKKRIGEKTKERFLDASFRQKHSEAVSRFMKKSGKFDEFIHNRAVKYLEECKKKTDLECYLDENIVKVKRRCEWCNKEFYVPFKNREQSFCSYSCSIHSRYNIFSVNETAENHKIVSVIEDGYEDVYNGTVDEYHNFGIILNKEKITSYGRQKLEIIYTLQCGEQPLWPFTSCNLSSINIAKFCKDGKFDFEALYKVTYDIMGLMDNIIDKMSFPDERFKVNVLKYRPVGIGIMGLSDAMFELDLKYDSNEGRQFAGEVMKTMTTACVEKSADLAAERGPFHDYDKVKDDVIAILSEHTGNNEKVMKKVRKYGVRNIQFTTCPPTGCLVGKTLVSSEKGMKKISDYRDALSNGPIKTVSDDGVTDIIRYFNQGIANTIKLTTNQGYEIEGTYNHKIRTLTNGSYVWKTLSELQENDIVVMKRGFNNSNNKKVSTSMAELLGFYMADGWWTTSGRGKRLHFSVTEESKNYIISLLKEIFGNNINVIYRKRTEKYGNIEINSKDVFEEFNRLNSIKNGAKNTFVPSVILDSDRETQLSFIRGYLEGDGCIRKNRGEINFKTISEEMAKTVQIMLLGLGYPSCVSTYLPMKKMFIENRQLQNINLSYSISIGEYYSLKLYKELYGKEFQIDSPATYSYRDYVLITEEERIFFEKRRKKIVLYDNMSFITRQIYEHLIPQENWNWFVKNDLYLQKIKKIEYNVNKEVHDLEVADENHTYIANGFITHNTTALTADASYGIEPSFGLVFQKTLTETGETINIVNPIFKKRFEKEDWYNEGLMAKITANGGSLKGLHGIPKKVRDIFVCAHDIKYKDRVDMQAELQKYCSSGISSTVNLPSTTTKEEISDLYKYAYKQGLKGITIYRDGCRQSQPITFSKSGTEVQSNFKRPSKLPGQVYTIETGNGKLYITITAHNNRPVEIFMSMGKSGQLFNVFGEALGRVISIALQHGVPLDSIIKTMKGIYSERPTWTRFEETDNRPVQILSIPDAVAKLLERYYLHDGKEEQDDHIDDKLFCTKCGTYSVILVEGCKTCLNCSESACS